MADAPNVVLIVLDAMRKDVLPAYGGTGRTPHLDEFCRDSTVYPESVTPAPWTLPSHASLFTGEFASRHGVHETQDRKTKDILGMMKRVGGETLAERLKKRGYYCAGITANSLLAFDEGFARGFESFVHVAQNTPTQEESKVIHGLAKYGKTKDERTRYMLLHGKFFELLRAVRTYRRINRRRKRIGFPMKKGGEELVRTIEQMKLDPPFFLFVNLLEMHDPYTAYERNKANRGSFSSVVMADAYGYRPIPDWALRNIRENYAGSAALVDSYFGRMISNLEGRRLLDNSLVIVTADHGQALKEHGFYGHGTFLHDEIVQIPLIVRRPRLKKEKPGDGYQNLVKVPKMIETEIEGGSGDGTLTEETTFSESFGGQISPPFLDSPEWDRKINDVRQRIDRPRKAMFSDGYKIVVDWQTRSVEELTHKSKPLDPGSNKDTVKSLLGSLAEFDAKSMAEHFGAPEFTEEEETVVMERLRELGYA